MYKALYMSYDSTQQISELLNAEIEKGWEFISTFGYIFIFKKIDTQPTQCDGE